MTIHYVGDLMMTHYGETGILTDVKEDCGIWVYTIEWNDGQVIRNYRCSNIELFKENILNLLARDTAEKECSLSR